MSDERRSAAVIQNNINVRTGPGAQFDIVGRLAQGASIPVTGRSPDGAWLQVAYPNDDSRGWISAQFVKIEGDLEDVGVVEPPSEPGPQVVEQENDVLVGGVRVAKKHAKTASSQSQTGAADQTDENASVDSSSAPATKPGGTIRAEPFSMKASMSVEGEPVAPSASEIGATFALNDRPRGDDRLGFKDYARAFAAMLTNPATQPPLTVGIYGAWGMGKSFLMHQLRQTLEKDKPADAPEFIHIDFNAWVYSGSENLWAGLVSRIYERIEHRLGAGATRSFRLDRNRRRQVRRLSLRAIFLALPVIAVTALLSLEEIARIWAELPGLAVLGISSTLALIVGFLRTAKSILDIVQKAFVERAEQLKQEAAQPDFRARIGFMADIKSEIDFLTDLLAEQGKDRSIRVVIFIDDLDRCAPAKAVEVLEAIMLLLSEDDSPFYVFLGIDARVMVKAIEERYGKVLVEAGISGYEYLDKIVQIPFVIPAASENRIKDYVHALLPRPGEESPRALIRPPVASGAPVSDQTTAPQADVESPPAVEVSFTDAELRALDDFAPFLTRNPRRAKRIVNIYRLTRMLADRARAGLPADQTRRLIKWVILTEQWPYRMGLIIGQCENAGQLGEGVGASDADDLVAVFAAITDKVHGPDGSRLIRLDDDPEVFYNFISRETTSITAADIRAFEPLTFNLNPALGGEIRTMLAKAFAMPQPPAANGADRDQTGRPPQLPVTPLEEAD